MNNDNFFQNLKNSVVSTIHSGLEEFVPILYETQFNSKGILTPKEFVDAGDLLCLKCPSWSWATGSKSKIKDYLPKNKQFLVTRNVPCIERVSSIKDKKIDFKQDGDLFIINNENQFEIDPENEIDDQEDEYLDSFEDVNLINSNLKKSDIFSTTSDKKSISSNVVKTRTYDMFITYDRYFRGPKLWLRGQSENGRILEPREVFEDIVTDYANKTATFEMHPHLENTPCISVHNCKHADILKKYSKGLRHDKAILLFLKFAQSVIPTINYDFTISIDVN